jgi:hypothetical protein
MRIRDLAIALCTVGCISLAPAQTTSENPYDYFGGLTYDASITTPQEGLGHSVGEHFTRHADQVRYLEHLAEASPRVVADRYGQSHQRRPLLLLTISAPEHLDRLDEILAANRELADPATPETRAAEIIDTNPMLVWFSYNVHGNEASTAEAAIQVAYTLAASTNPEVERILRECVVIIDPMINPDGHERYVSWYENTVGKRPNPNPAAIEHDEPWPGGRTNHYLFDLNRDWIWRVHPESRSRIAAYRKRLPQLHIDHHEQSYRSPFFFGAGDEPYNTNIPQETKDWIEKYGEANADAFDERGLVYSTKERFDYLYTGYGKVLPVYHGAIGMLAEKGGHSRAGLAIALDENNTLTLTARAQGHFVLGMSNLVLSANNRREQLERFRRFFVRAAQRSDAPTYFVSPDSDPAMLAKLSDLCHAHGIRIDQLTEPVTSNAIRAYIDTREVDLHGDARPPHTLPAGSWVISAAQPMGDLVNAMFEADPELTSIDTYDITAWSLPVVFGLDAYFTNDAISAQTQRISDWSPPAPSLTGDGRVAMVVDAAQHHFPRAVGVALGHGLFVRFAGSEISVDDRRFSMGSMIIHGVRNQTKDLDAVAEDMLEAGLSVHRTDSGMTGSGPVLGANANPIADLPKILLIRGDGSAYSFGQHWHLLDIESPLPHTQVLPRDLERIDMGDYNVLVLPDGVTLDVTASERVRDWVRDGGTLIASDSAGVWAAKEIAGAKPEATDSAESGSFADRKDQSAVRRVPGSLLTVELDTTHPLSAGLDRWIGALKRGRQTLPQHDGFYPVGVFRAPPTIEARSSDSNPGSGGRIGGWISDENLEKIMGTPFAAHYNVGSGVVICLSDDVTFRGFHHPGMRLLLNAIIYGPTLRDF